MTLGVLTRTTTWDLATYLSVLFVPRRQDIRFRSLTNKEGVFLCSKFCILLDFRVMKCGLWLFNGARTQQLKFNHLQSAQNLILKLSVSGSLREMLFLSTHAILVQSVKLTLKVYKLSVAKIQFWMKHISSSHEEMDVRRSVHCNNFFGKPDGKQKNPVYTCILGFYIL